MQPTEPATYMSAPDRFRHCCGGAISVIVPARNVERTIGLCLESILAESHSTSLQVIVVDNGSSDRTLEIIRSFPVTLLEVPPGFVSRSRNAGVAQARHNLLAFVDSDCVVLTGWARCICSAFLRPDVGAAGSRHLLREQPTWVERAWYGRRHWQRLNVVRNADYVPAGNLAVRRDVFAAVGGFDESLETGEDPDLCMRIAAQGLHIIEDPGIRCAHLGEPQSLAEVFRRERWHGRGLRARYSSGRLAPIAVSTVLFLLTLLASLVALAIAVARFESWPLYFCSLAFLVPFAYAIKYAKPCKPLHFCQLISIYFAYFMGRIAALPVVMSRALERKREARRPDRGQS